MKRARGEGLFTVRASPLPGHRIDHANSLLTSHESPDYRLPITKHELRITCHQPFKSPTRCGQLHHYEGLFKIQSTWPNQNSLQGENDGEPKSALTTPKFTYLHPSTPIYAKTFAPKSKIET